MPPLLVTVFHVQYLWFEKRRRCCNHSQDTSLQPLSRPYRLPTGQDNAAGSTSNLSFPFVFVDVAPARYKTLYYSKNLLHFNPVGRIYSSGCTKAILPFFESIAYHPPCQEMAERRCTRRGRANTDGHGNDAGRQRQVVRPCWLAWQLTALLLNCRINRDVDLGDVSGIVPGEIRCHTVVLCDALIRADIDMPTVRCQSGHLIGQQTAVVFCVDVLDIPLDTKQPVARSYPEPAFGVA